MFQQRINADPAYRVEIHCSTCGYLICGSNDPDLTVAACSIAGMATAVMNNHVCYKGKG